MSSPWMTPRGSIGYITVPLLVQIRLILATVAEVPTGRDIWGGGGGGGGGGRGGGGGEDSHLDRGDGITLLLT